MVNQLFLRPFSIAMLNYQRVSGWLVVSNMKFIFHFIYGMSSFPLTNSIIFQDGYCTTNQKSMGYYINTVYIWEPPNNGGFEGCHLQSMLEKTCKTSARVCLGSVFRQPLEHFAYVYIYRERESILKLYSKYNWHSINSKEVLVT